METLETHTVDGVLLVCLMRPRRRNAINAAMLARARRGARLGPRRRRGARPGDHRQRPGVFGRPGPQGRGAADFHRRYKQGLQHPRGPAQADGGGDRGVVHRRRPRARLGLRHPGGRRRRANRRLARQYKLHRRGRGDGAPGAPVGAGARQGAGLFGCGAGRRSGPRHRSRQPRLCQRRARGKGRRAGPRAVRGQPHHRRLRQAVHERGGRPAARRGFGLLAPMPGRGARRARRTLHRRFHTGKGGVATTDK